MKKGKSQGKFSTERNRGNTSPLQVTLNVVPGPASPARKQAWRNFWAKLISEGKHTAGEDNTSSDESG